jgi:hypothetical protein
MAQGGGGGGSGGMVGFEAPNVMIGGVFGLSGGTPESLVAATI